MSDVPASQSNQTKADGTPAAASCELTTFYNGDCPVCRAEMTRYAAVAQKRGLPLAFCDVAQDAEPAEPLGLTPDRALRRLHAVDATGKLHIGFDAMLLVWSKVPGVRWLARFFGLPGIKSVSAWLYEHVVSWSLYRLAKRRATRRAAREAATG